MGSRRLQSNNTSVVVVPANTCTDLLDNGFDAVKIDNCGDDGRSFTMRTSLINASGKPLMIENSNQGFGNPADRRWNNPHGVHSHGACEKEGVPPTMACPGCNNSLVGEGNCGRGNPNRTIAGDWCPYNMFRTNG